MFKKRTRLAGEKRCCSDKLTTMEGEGEKQKGASAPWGRTGKPGVLQSMGSQESDTAARLNNKCSMDAWQELRLSV